MTSPDLASLNGVAGDFGTKSLPPIQRLPPETLGEIFLHVVWHPQRGSAIFDPFSEPKSTAPYTPSYRSCASPYSISHVCKRWRTLILTSPELWANLRVVWPTRDHLVLLVEEWLARAKSRPLSLSLHEALSRRHLSCMKLIVHHFISAIHRCRSLELSANSQLPNLFTAAELAMPGAPRPQILETINVKLRMCREEEITALARLLHSSPKLRSATWGSRFLDIFLRDVCQNWGSLRELTLYTSLSLLDLLPALAEATNLEKLVLHEKAGTILIGTVTTITLPRLRSLSAPLEGHFPSLFGCISLPALTNLELLALDSAGWGQLVAMLRRSNASLRLFKIHQTSVPLMIRAYDDSQCIQTLRQPYFEDLRSLEIEYSVSPRFIRFLTLRHAAPHDPYGAEAAVSDGDGDSSDESVEEGHVNRFLRLERLALRLNYSCVFEDWDALAELVGSRAGASDATTMASYVSRDTRSGHMKLLLDIPG